MTNLSFMDGRETLNEAQQRRRATPKGRPNVLTKEEARKSKTKREDEFRAAVWTRDCGKCRATGVMLVKSGTIDAHRLGEVDHTLLRSTHPDRIYDVENGVLISKFLNRLRKKHCANNAQYLYFDYSGPGNRGELQAFVWRDDDGKVIKTRKG